MEMRLCGIFGGFFLTSFQTYFSLHKYLRVGSDRICSTIVLGMPLQKL